MKKKILFVINTLGGAGAEMALLELLEKLEKENEKTKDVQYEISLYAVSYTHLDVYKRQGLIYPLCTSGIFESVLQDIVLRMGSCICLCTCCIF